jgi:hypothetical protein
VAERADQTWKLDVRLNCLSLISITMPLILQPTATGSYGLSETETSEEILGADTYGGSSTESNAMRWTSQEDELASALEDCVSVLQSGLQRLQDISIEDLVFCEPPNDADPLIPPPLQFLATKNLLFLHYHDWIMTLYSETQKLNCGMFECCECIKHSLLDDL